MFHFPFVDQLTKLITRNLERDTVGERAALSGTNATTSAACPIGVADSNHSHGSLRPTCEEVRQLLGQ
jgi:hypothetical protein